MLWILNEAYLRGRWTFGNDVISAKDTRLVGSIVLLIAAFGDLLPHSSLLVQAPHEVLGAPQSGSKVII